MLLQIAPSGWLDLLIPLGRNLEENTVNREIIKIQRFLISVY